MKGKTVLVVDDDEDLRETIAMALEEESYRVLTASNGRRALEVLAQEKPEDISCIVLDWMMPEMGGEEFLQHLNEDRADFSRVPVVVATAMGLSVQKDKILYPVSRIQKPMELEELYRVLEKAVESRPAI
jgi:CheY-like chemotaxis protein